jgi:hypothetical protein
MKKTIIILAIVFVALEAADGLVTLWGTNNGIPEANPLFAPFANTWFLPLVKIAFGLLVAWGLVQVAKRFPKARRLATIGLALGVGIQTLVMALWGVAFIMA